jgi:2-dehydropantoate 2-reductase
MRIGIIGAGAVGGTLAALLARAGHEIAVTARGENLETIRLHGIRVDGGFGTHVARVDAHPHLREAPDLAILATKAQDAEAALATELPRLEGVPLLVVQNGLGGLDVAHRIAPASPLIGGLALFAASYLEPGHVTVTGANPVIVGAAAGTDPALFSQIADVLRDAMPIEVTPDIVGAQWTKLLINHVNALPAITGMSVQQVVADRGLRRAMTASMRETVRIARRAGVRFARVQGVSGRVLDLVGTLPLGVGGLFPRLLARRMGSVPNPGSTLQSIRRGQRTEIDFLNGAVLEVADRVGTPAPVNRAIVAMVHEVEDSGAFLPADEVVRRVGQRTQ